MSRPKSSDHEEFTEILEMFRRASTGETEDAFASFDDPEIHSRISDNQLRAALDRIPELRGYRSYIPAEILARIYADARSQRFPEQGVARSELEMVADELRLTAELSLEDLNRIRREYALSNHPDLVAPSRRDQATRRMTIANMLIDQAVKQKRNGAPL